MILFHIWLMIRVQLINIKIMEVKLFGKPSYSYEYLKSTIEDVIKMANLDIELNEVQETSEFIKEELNQIPAIKFNGEVKVFKNNSIKKFSKNVTQWILKKMDYGSLRKLIVPIDYSETSENALAYAKSLSEKQNQFLELTHCYTPKVVGLNEQAIVDFKEEKFERENFKEYAASINQSWNGKDADEHLLDSQFLIGFPSDRLVQISREDAQNLIVIGSNGKAGIEKRVFGSVTTNVATKSECPVLIVPPESNYKEIKNILYCCDDTRLDSQVIPGILDFSRGYNPMIHLVHVSEENDYDESLIMDVWNKLYHIDRVRYNKLVHKVQRNILKGYCEQNEIDLIVVARPQRGFLSNLLHKSFTKEMVIYTDTPLLIINEKK